MSLLLLYRGRQALTRAVTGTLSFTGTETAPTARRVALAGALSFTGLVAPLRRGILRWVTSVFGDSPHADDYDQDK